MTADANKTSEGFEYLRGRFLKKNGVYIDASRRELPTYRADDLLAVLKSMGFTHDQCQMAAQRLRRDDLRVWSGREVFDPGRERIIDNGGGMADVNVWMPSEVRPADGDVGPFIEYVGRLLPVAAERDWLLNFLAFRYRNLGLKPKHGVILYGSRQGTGKSTLGDIVEKVFGNTKRITNVEGLVGRFSAPNWNSAWVIAEEIKVTAGGTTYNALKDLITGTTKEGERKGQDFAAFDTPAALLLLSNYEPSFIEADDRRFFIAEVTSDSTKEELHDYFVGFRRWLEEDDGYGKIAGFLSRRDTGDYSPTAPPPTTEAKKKLIGLVKTGLLQEVSDWLEDLGADFVTEEDLRLRFDKVSQEQMRHLMSAAGWQKHDSRETIKGKRYRLWHRSGTKIECASGKRAVLIDARGRQHCLGELLEQAGAALEDSL